MKNILVYVVGGFFVVGALSSIGRSEPTSPEVAEAAKKPAVYTADDYAAGGELMLKKMMHDPKKFELINTYAISELVSCYEYRAANGFGAIRIGHAIRFASIFFTESDKGFAKVWNKQCTKQGRSK